MPDPRPFAGGAPLVRRCEPRWTTRPHRTWPRRHGPKMKRADPSTRPEPSAEHKCEDAGYEWVRVRAWANYSHPKVRAHEGRGRCGLPPIVVGTLVVVEVERLPRGERRGEPRVLWLRWHGFEEAAALEPNSATHP